LNGFGGKKLEIRECWLLGIGENKQKGDNFGGYYEALPSQQK
jgi:hypothetical protein